MKLFLVFPSCFLLCKLLSRKKYRMHQCTIAKAVNLSIQGLVISVLKVT